MFRSKPLAKQAAELRKTVQAEKAQAAKNEANTYYLAMMADIELPEDETEESGEVADHE